MAFLHVNYEDGSQWLVSHCEVVIPAGQAQHLTAQEIGVRVQALLPRILLLEEHIWTWDCNPRIKTLDDFDAHLTEPLKPRQRPYLAKPSVPTKSTKGFVYIIRGESYYKIGRTEDPYRRLTPMTAHAPFPLETLLLIPTDDMHHTERCLHVQFALKHQRGEWYNLTEDDLVVIRREYKTIDPTVLKAN